MMTSDCSVALRLIAEAVSLAVAAGAPRYVAPITDTETGDVTLQIVEDEPDQDHVVVDPFGECRLVYVPSDP